MFKRGTNKEREQGSSPEVDSTPIADARPRERITILGRVEQMRAQPRTGLPFLVITVADDTGTVRVQWTGRRALGGVTLGRRIAVHGVARRVGDRLEFTNPAYELLP